MCAPVCRIFAAALNPAQTIEQLENRMLACIENAETIEKKADAEDREKTEEELSQFKASLDESDRLRAEIANRRRLAEAKADLSQLQPRRTVPGDVQIDSIQQEQRIQKPQPRTLIKGGVAANAGTHGFHSFGEFARCVVQSSRTRGLTTDPRLTINAGPSTYGQEAVGEDGGFAVPPDFRAEIMQKVMGEDSLLQYCDEQTSSSNQLTVPKDETTAWQTSGGIQAYWENEAAQIAASKPELQSVTVRLNKLAALVPVTDELLEDAGALSNYLRRKAPEKIVYKINEAIVNGTGAGQPQGIMTSGAKVTVSKESAQSGTVVLANITKMWARMYGPCRRNAIWLMNQDVEPQLQQMVVTGTASVGFPAYLPPGGLSGLPYATLMGRPIVTTEACQTLATEGDIILVDLKQYLAVTKIGGMRQDVSIHLWFDYDVTAFRFVIRVGGQSWWTNAIARKNGTNKLSHIVTVETR